MIEAKDKLFYKIVKNHVKLLFKFLFKTQMVGIENIPAEGRILLTGNHTEWLNPVLIVIATKRQDIFLRKKNCFKE